LEAEIGSCGLGQGTRTLSFFFCSIKTRRLVNIIFKLHLPQGEEVLVAEAINAQVVKFFTQFWSVGDAWRSVNRN
jgi:hypothetical protein